MKVTEADLTKRRRVSSGGLSTLSAPPAATHSHHGFIDTCRFCNKQILRKGQSRPRICLECEKKKATPIHDRCKDCREPIVRNNVRKARICPKCKKNRERKKNETPYASGGLPQRILLQGSSARIYAVNSWLYQIAQGHDPFYDVFGKAPWESGALPPKSRWAKIRTETFSTPEDIVTFLMSRLQNQRTSTEVSQGGRDEQPGRLDVHHGVSPILIPQVNPFEIRDVPVEELRQENEALAAIMSKRLPKSPPVLLPKTEVRIKEEITDEDRSSFVIGRNNKPETLPAFEDTFLDHDMLEHLRLLDSNLDTVPSPKPLNETCIENQPTHLEKTVVQSLCDLIQEPAEQGFSLNSRLIVPKLLSLHVPRACNSSSSSNIEKECILKNALHKTQLECSNLDQSLLSTTAKQSGTLDFNTAKRHSSDEEAELLYKAALSTV